MTQQGRQAIDPLTAFVFAIAMMLLNGSVLGMLHGELPSALRPAAHSWRVATLLIACAVMLFIAQQVYPGAMWLLVVANGLMTFGVSVYALALRQFYGLQGSRLMLIVPAVFTVLGVWWFVAVMPGMVGRISVSTLCWLVALIDGLAVLWRQRRDESTSRRVLMGVFGLVTAFAAGRVAWFLLAPDPGSSVFQDSNTLNAISPMVLSILPVIGTTVFLLMCSDRIRRHWEEAASVDYLTSLPNRRILAGEGERRVQAARSGGLPLALAVLDVDFFKRINDVLGHEVGDEALAHVATLLRRAGTEQDLIVRLGGEEFVILLANTSLGVALQRMEQLRADVAGQPYRKGELRVPITVSIGVAWLDVATRDFNDLMRRADAALYDAKAAGRNCVRTNSDNAELRVAEVTG